MIFIVLRKKSLETKNSDIIPSKKGSDHLTFAVGGGGGGRWELKDLAWLVQMFILN